MFSFLFTPLRLRDIELRNRVVISPMWQYCGVDGYPTDWHLMHLGRFADGGAGLVFQEATAVERRGRGTQGDLGIWNDSFVEPYRRVVELIHANGAAAGIQLGHCGRKSRIRHPMEGRGPLEKSDAVPDWDEWEPIGPSPIPVLEDWQPPRAMTAQDIADVVRAFAAATERARAAGYDVVELHAAHGYLIHEFLSPQTNQRNDEWGGSRENRARLLFECAAAVRAVWPAGKPLFVRLSSVDGGGWELTDTVWAAGELSRLGVDVIDCSAGGLQGVPMNFGQLDYGYQVKYAAAVKAAGVASMAVGLIIHPELAERIVADGQADLVAIGREALHNPNWPLDAAFKLGVDDPYALVGRQSGYWLRQRARRAPHLTPSTYTASVSPVGE